MCRSRYRRIAGSLVVALAAGAAWAQEPYDPPPHRVPARIGPEFQVNVHALFHQHHPDVGIDLIGNTVFVWVSETRPNGSGRALFARRSDYIGEMVSGDLLVSDDVAVDWTGGRVAVAPDGRFVVAWSSPGASGVHARCFSATGNAVGPPVRLDTGGQLASVRPDIALVADEAVVAWAEQRSGPDPVLARRLTLDCVPGATTAAGTVGLVLQVGIAALSPGWVVAWTGYATVDHPRAWARPFTADGTPRHAKIFVDADATPAGAAGGWLHSPVPLPRADGGFALVWGSHGIGINARAGIFARNFSPTFTGGPVIRLSADPWAGALAADTFFDGALVAWSSAGERIVGRRFDASWAPDGEEFPVNSYPHDTHEDPAVSVRAALSEGVPYGLWTAAWSSGTHEFGGVPPGGEGEVTQDGSYFGVFAQRFSVECTLAAATQLCLADRLRITVTFRRSDGTIGQGQAFPLTADTGGFWFFDADNPELLVKVVDGRAVNGRFWIFYGALSDVEFDLVVRHPSYYAFTRERTYHNPQGTIASGADVESFGECENCARAGAPKSPPVTVVALPLRRSPAASHPPATCAGTVTELCLRSGRFQASVTWRGAGGASGPGHAVRFSDEAGYFWFFDPANVELFVKVLDGTAVNGHQWVFLASLTDLGFTLAIGDLADGHAVEEYHNSPGVMAGQVDTSAF